MSLDFRNTNSLWGSVIVESLRRCGVRQAVIAPGSRSAPLAFAFARHEGIESIPVLDERSAAFFALGLARCGRRPVAVVCTSGTAAANFFPAIIEAHESGVPLVILTADRPPELRGCGSGQTIDQQKLYGDYVVFSHEVAVPEPTVPMLRYLRQTTAYACTRSLQPIPGPVHLNVPFRDPLVPAGGESAEGLKAAIGKVFFDHLCEAEPAPAPPARTRRAVARGLIVAGPAAAADPGHQAAAIGRLAAALGWPVLADGLSSARHFEIPGAVRVTTYDAILRNEKLARSLMPEQVLCLGGWPTSRVLRAWIEASGAEIVLAAGMDANRDALHGRTHWMPLDAVGFEAGAAHDPGWSDVWAGAEKRARKVIDGALESAEEMFEPKAAWLLAQKLPAGTPVFVASSMPVRDVEYFWPPGANRHQFFFNRGANGIDGTLSTALGVAHGGVPTVLLTGDLALLHDSNGFLIKPKFRGSLTIVLINNRGGGIFEHLPVAQFNPPFEDFFATPQEADFGKLALAHGIEHIVVTDWKKFGALVSKLPAAGIRILELRTDRKMDAVRRKQILGDACAQP